MTKISEEKVVAFVDDRLSREDRIAFEARLADDPALAARVASHRWIAQQIVAAYGTPPGDEVPAPLLDRLGLAATDNVIAMQDRRRRWLVPAALAGALAASLTLGIGLGRSVFGPDALVHGDRSNQLTAGAVLADGLSNNLAGQQSGPVRIGISFRTAQGICRTFSIADGPSGLGCRQGSAWTVPVVVAPEAPVGPLQEYQLAAGSIAPSVMAEVDRRITGEPLSPSEERQLRAKGWN
ncbi:anti-sigma factor family protein [Sphingomonas lycopersici]|uniref:Anti-sigma factor n=1 Tax=Sphingomonas lycopersici TaxID=2951807 RepID=A0AA41ZCT5_9SPHN|nr:hypothetical protein [Sphingomonas lycopersici]MCW6536982.1 hypothetical protein [Sphingomonas lycopersici]